MQMSKERKKENSAKTLNTTYRICSRCLPVHSIIQQQTCVTVN